MTLIEIVYQIQNLRSGGIKSDDTKLSDEQVADIIHYYRAKLIRQEIDRNMKLDPMLIQSLLDVELERVVFNRSEPLSGRTVFRTINKLPRAIATKGSNLVTFVGQNLLGQAFQRSTAYKSQFDIARPFTALNPKWFEFDERVYVITEDPLEHITIQLVAENPTKVLEFIGELDPFRASEYEYPVSITIMDSIFKLMADSELKYSNVPTDEINDGQEDPTNRQSKT